MGLLGKLAGKAAKTAFEYAAIGFFDKGYDQQLKDAYINQPCKEDTYPPLAGHSTFTIDRFSQPNSKRPVRDNAGKILCYIKEKSSGKRYAIYDTCENELFSISAAKGNRAIVRCKTAIYGKVSTRLTLKGFLYTPSWRNWQISANLLNTKRVFFSQEAELATTQFFPLRRDAYLIYVRNKEDLEDLIIVTLSIDAIQAYNSEKTGSTSPDRHEPISKEDKKAGKKQSEKESFWTKILEAEKKDRGWLYDDDDDD